MNPFAFVPVNVAGLLMKLTDGVVEFVHPNEVIGETVTVVIGRGTPDTPTKV